MSILAETLKKIDDGLPQGKDDNEIQAYCLRVITQLDKLVQDFPQNAQVFSLRGKILGKLKRFTDGIKDFENACSLSKPIDPEILYQYGNLLKDNMKYEEAIKKYARCLGLSAGKHAKASNSIAVVYSLLGKYDEAIPYVDRAIQQEKKNAQYYFNRAMLYFKKISDQTETKSRINMYRLIIQDLETAVHLDPNTRNFRKNLIDITRRMQKELEIAADAQPENKKYRTQLVEINGKLQGELETAVRLEPENKRYRRYLDEFRQTQAVPAYQAIEQDEEEINPQDWQPSFSDKEPTPSVDSVPPLLPPPVVATRKTPVKTPSQSQHSLPPEASVAGIPTSEPQLNPTKRKSSRGSQSFFSPVQATAPTPYETSKRTKKSTQTSSDEYVASLVPPSLPRATSSDKIGTPNYHPWQSQPKTPTPPNITPTPPNVTTPSPTF